MKQKAKNDFVHPNQCLLGACLLYSWAQLTPFEVICSLHNYEASLLSLANTNLSFCKMTLPLTNKREHDGV